MLHGLVYPVMVWVVFRTVETAPLVILGLTLLEGNGTIQVSSYVRQRLTRVRPGHDHRGICWISDHDDHVRCSSGSDYDEHISHRSDHDEHWDS